MANQTRAQQLKRRHDQSGQATFTLLFVIVAAALYLLVRTEVHAANINNEAKIIASTGQGINQSTDSIVLLNHTAKVASEIQDEAAPVEPLLLKINSDAVAINGTAGTILTSAKSINGSATSINGSATSVGSTANAINGTAKTINASAGQILTIAGTINHGVGLINANADVTIGLANAILGNANNIVNEANRANTESAAIDHAVNLG
jgi:hypothetical protein